MLPFLFFAFTAGPLSQPAPVSPSPPALIKTIPLPGVHGRIDHMDFDEVSGRLFIAALGNNSLEVVDIDKGDRVRSIPDLPEPQGVVVAGNRKGVVPSVIATCGGDGCAHILDPNTFRSIKTLRLAPDADNARLAWSRVYVGCGSDNAAAIARFSIDSEATMNSSTVRWPLKGHPEGLALLFSRWPKDNAGAPAQHPDLHESRLLVNVPAAHEVSTIDLNSGDVAHWPIKDAAANFPISAWQEWTADHTHSTDRVVTGCRQPPTVLLLDARDGHQLASAPCAHDVDDLILSPDHTRLYAICGGDGGVIDCFAVTPDSLASAGRTATSPGARTGLGIMAADHFVIVVACPENGKAPAEIRLYTPTPQPAK